MMRFSSSQLQKVTPILEKQGYDKVGIALLFNQANYGDITYQKLMKDAIKEAEKVISKAEGR